MIRTLAQVQDEINDTADRWHKLIQRLGAGEDLTPEITDLEAQLDRLYAEKRLLKTGPGAAGIAGPQLSALTAMLEARVRMSLHKYRAAGAETYPW